MLGCAADRLVLLSPQHLVCHTSIPPLLTLDKKHLQISRERAWKHLEKGNRLLVCDRGGLKVCDGVEINVWGKHLSNPSTYLIKALSLWTNQSNNRKTPNICFINLQGIYENKFHKQEMRCQKCDNMLWERKPKANYEDVLESEIDMCLLRNYHYHKQNSILRTICGVFDQPRVQQRALCALNKREMEMWWKQTHQMFNTSKITILLVLPEKNALITTSLQ